MMIRADDDRLPEGPRRPPRGAISFETYIEWLDEDTWAEWVDGEVTVLSPASKRHQKITLFLLDILYHFVSAHDLGEILPAPYPMKIGELRPSGREPDIIFVAACHDSRFQETHLEGPADMVVEVVSPESRKRDRQVKFAEYEAGGVPEYWLIDYKRKRVEFYHLDGEGVYQLMPLDEGGIFHSKSLPGLRLNVNWLWQDPLPPPMEVLRLMGLAGSS